MLQITGDMPREERDGVVRTARVANGTRCNGWFKLVAPVEDSPLI